LSNGKEVSFLLDLTLIKDTLRFKKKGERCFIHAFGTEFTKVNYTFVYITDRREFSTKARNFTYMEKHGFASYRDMSTDIKTVLVRAWEFSIATIPGLREIDGHWITEEERSRLGGPPIP
jgi:hypothetical protein